MIKEYTRPLEQGIDSDKNRGFGSLCDKGLA